jgi:hypothetical protein
MNLPSNVIQLINLKPNFLYDLNSVKIKVVPVLN